MCIFNIHSIWMYVEGNKTDLPHNAKKYIRELCRAREPHMSKKSTTIQGFHTIFEWLIAPILKHSRENIALNPDK